MKDTDFAPATGYTKAELARHFHVPESTIRYYCARFAPYLPALGEGRGRRYPPSCLEVLAFIRSRLPEVRTSRALDAELALRFPHGGVTPALPVQRGHNTIPDRFAGCEPPRNAPVSAAGDGQAALRLLERQSDALDRIAAALDVLVEQGRRTPSPMAELESLREEVRTLRLLVASSEKTQQDDLNQLRQWLTRLAREQAGSEGKS